MHKFLSQLLIYVPNVAALDLFKVIVKLRVVFLSHIVLSEKVRNKRVANVVVGFKVCDQLGAR